MISFLGYQLWLHSIKVTWHKYDIVHQQLIVCLSYMLRGFLLQSIDVIGRINVTDKQVEPGFNKSKLPAFILTLILWCSNVKTVHMCTCICWQEYFIRQLQAAGVKPLPRSITADCSIEERWLDFLSIVILSFYSKTASA